MLYYLRWILATPLLLLFLWAAVFNLRVVALICRNAVTGERRRVPSFGPLIGGLAGVAGLLLCPVEGVSRYAWLALVVDVGSLPYFVLMLPLLLGLWFKGEVRGEER
jgi:hypothetical protein